MAADGSKDETLAEGKQGAASGAAEKPTGKRARKAKATPPEESGEKAGGKSLEGVDPLSIDLENTDPRSLPPYRDPKGRRITSRHSRRAVREAAALGIDPVNPNHALYIAAQAGVDIFSGSAPSILDMAKSNAAEADKPENLPVMQNPDDHNMLAPQDKKKKKNQVAKPVPITESEREKAVAQIQAALIRRRRGRMVALVLRLVVFVGLPTFLMGYYYANIATNMYETETEFVIQTSENPATAGGLGGLLAGTGFATSQDSVVVQGYLSSREAFRRLNEDHDYVAHFKNPDIDVIQRLPADATLDEAFAYFRKKVTIGYDPTEGIIRLTVVAATAEASQTFAEALVGYAEERVDGLTQEARGDQLQIAESRYLDAEQQMLDAERRVLELQQQRGVVSAEVELSSQMSIINSLELQVEQKRLDLAELLDNERPSDTRVDVARKEIQRLQDRITELRSDLTQTSDNSVSLARISGELRIAESNLATRHLILQESIAAMETSRLEANRQVRYLSLGVAPVAPSEPTYPKKFEGTLLAGIVFLAIYIMASLTLSILREQVSV